MTVAILPEAEDVDIKIEEKDLIIETYRSSGNTSMNVNLLSFLDHDACTCIPIDVVI